MPLIKDSSYKPTLPFRSGHFNTIYAAMVRKVKGVTLKRERLLTPDRDFLDLDWSRIGSDCLMIASHGLEGNAERPYMKGMIRHFNRQGWDAVGINFRGCSGELNKHPYSYNMGWTQDLNYVIQQILEKDIYRKIVLIGFSLGGNVTLKYLGEKGTALPKVIKKAVAFSVPCDIESSNERINRWDNTLYLMRFMRSLNAKARLKAQAFPDQMQFNPPRLPRRFNEYDEVLTAPVHGFSSAKDYWTRSSSKQFLPSIPIPTLLINARNDSFLSGSCYPFEIATQSSSLFLETPQWGGHVGFVALNKTGTYWSEQRAWAFVKEGLSE